MIKKQEGFLLLIAVVLIIVMGFIGIVVVYMLAGSATSIGNFSLAEKAFYIAEGGLEKATRYLLTPALSGTPIRISCSALTGNSNLTNSGLGSGVNAGTFTVTTVSGSPFYANSTLSAALTSSATTLSAVSTSGFASSGRLLVDGEEINYSAISGSSFIGLTRGVNNTVASAHTSGAHISQYACYLDSLGGIANLISPLAKRELRQSVQLQEAWAVGDRNTNYFVFTHWNYPSELAWSSALILDATNRNSLNAVSLTSNADGWAVGDLQNNNFTIVALNGSSWSPTPVAGGCSGQNLLGVSTVSSQEAWTVGVRYRVTTCSSGNYRYTILKWNGSSWTKLSSSTTPSIPADGSSSAIQNLNAVHVISTTNTGAGNIGFAVGDVGQIIKYNGTAWATDSSPITNNLTGVFVVSTSEAWAVGAAGKILKWNGSTWSSVTSPTTTALSSIYMLDTNGDGIADAGWAVGNNGVAITYNGSTWSSQNAGGNSFLSVAAFSKNDVWATGNSGRVAHWDGSAWTDMTSNVTNNLNGIAIVAPGPYPFSAWQEVFA